MQLIIRPGDLRGQRSVGKLAQKPDAAKAYCAACCVASLRRQVGHRQSCAGLCGNGRR